MVILTSIYTKTFKLKPKVERRQLCKEMTSSVFNDFKVSVTTAEILLMPSNFIIGCLTLSDTFDVQVTAQLVTKLTALDCVLFLALLRTQCLLWLQQAITFIKRP